MSQKQNLQGSTVRYFIKLSAITSGIILVFSIGLGIVTNNLEKPKSKQVLGTTELLNSNNTLPKTGRGDPSQPSKNPQNPNFVNNTQVPKGSPQNSSTRGNPSPGTNRTQRISDPSQPSKNPQNPNLVDNPQVPKGSPQNSSTRGNPSPGTNSTQPVFESDTVICYQQINLVKDRKDQMDPKGPIDPPIDPKPIDPIDPIDPKPIDPDKTSIICFPKNTPQQPPVINNSNILNAGSSNNKCPDVYISTTQPNNPVIPNISINNFPDQNSNNLQKLNQNLACETNFPWWIVVLLSVSLASSLIYLNSQTKKTSSQNSKPKSVVVS
jgi:hypothetical protein